jgi:hypothetical protein
MLSSVQSSSGTGFLPFFHPVYPMPRVPMWFVMNRNRFTMSPAAMPVEGI